LRRREGGGQCLAVSAFAEKVYESRELLEQYLAFHFASVQGYCPWAEAPRGALAFPQRVAEQAMRHGQVAVGCGARALDLGCAVGGTALELTRAYDEVLGVDLSENFVRHAEAVARGELNEFEILVEGSIRKKCKLVRSCAWRPECVHFLVGNACQLSPWPGDFDLVVMANLLCRTPDPRAVLAQAHSLVRPGGMLVITTPCTWLEQFTPKEKWLCENSGGTLTGLRTSLDADFDLRERCDMPFLIREHERKYQWSVAEATVWRRKQGW